MIEFQVRSKKMTIGKNKGKTVYYAYPKAKQNLTNKMVIDRIVRETRVRRDAQEAENRLHAQAADARGSQERRAERRQSQAQEEEGTAQAARRRRHPAPIAALLLHSSPGRARKSRRSAGVKQKQLCPHRAETYLLTRNPTRGCTKLNNYGI